MSTATTSLDRLCIDTIRTLAMDVVQKANSGHPGTPMGAATMAYTLWTRFLRHNPSDPAWPDRDRFVLSAGHASALLYILLHLTGYDLPLDELKRFRQFGSKTPGHPERGHTPGVEVTSGPLGQGFGMAVGLAVAERWLAARFNRPGHTVVDHYTYGVCSDGDMMEGVSAEAASLAGTLGLGKLIFLYDDNEISIEGDTDLAFTEDVGRRFGAYNWHVQHVDGEDVGQVARALEAARAETARPSLIVARTTIAYGSPNMAGSAETHGSPLGEDEVRATKEALGWPAEERFRIPPEALADFRRALADGAALQADWEARLDAYARDYPEDAALFRAWTAGELPAGWQDVLPAFSGEEKPMATRAASGRCITVLAEVLGNLVGGSADLAPSTNTYMKGLGDMDPEHPGGRNMHFGVREHAMGTIVNGMAIHGGLIPFGATFLVFSDYMRGAIRLAALQRARSIFVFTHDSIGLGEDGPTHQPIEHLASLRAMPNLTLIRPADANETAAAWGCALQADGPVALVLTRQALPVLADVGRIREGVPRGAYVVADAPSGTPDVILLATGSEVSLAIAAREQLASDGIAARVVSMPSWELFEAQPQEYRHEVLPPTVRARLAVEAASPLGWAKYVGNEGDVVGLEHFGASAPYKVLFEEFGFTAENVAARARAVVQRLREM
ncbi:MAG: transketolase [Dehalococcoidia bacterium]|nr:transketolase [Dehalococcoidia bacterium]